jgi:predicted anti-sigma-YlaC factor YlaD
MVSEFAERKLTGKSLAEGLKAVELHLDVCVECKEEYQALQAALRDMDP